MVGHAVLGEVVGADALAAIARADQRLPLAGPLFVLLLALSFVEPRLEHAQGLGKILVLALFVLALHDDAGLLVRQPHGRGGLVDVLAAGPARAKRVLAKVLRLQIDFHVLRLGQHGHGGRRGVDAALGFRLGHALHAMSAAFVLQLAIHSFAFQAQDDFLEAAQFRGAEVQHLDLPSLAFGVPLVHFIQIAGKQRRFVAAGAGANLHHEPIALGVLAADGHAQNLVPQRLALLPQSGQLGLGHFAHLAVLAVDHFLGFGDLLVEGPKAAVLFGEFSQRAVFARGGGDARRLRQHFGIDQLLLQLFEAVELVIQRFAQRHLACPPKRKRLPKTLRGTFWRLEVLDASRLGRLSGNRNAAPRAHAIEDGGAQISGSYDSVAGWAFSVLFAGFLPRFRLA